MLTNYYLKKMLDGGLIGGAALKAEDFTMIISAANQN
jgi:triosephosphate isomerase